MKGNPEVGPAERSVTLRPVETEDLDFLADLANDPEVRANVVGWGWPVARSGQSDWYRKTLTDDSKQRFLVCNEAGERIGLAEIVDVDFRSGTAAVGLKLGGTPGARGRGYGGLVLGAIREFAFTDMGLRKLTAQILADNVPSLRLFTEKGGWVVEGVRRAQVLHRGEYKDLVQVGLFREGPAR